MKTWVLILLIIGAFILGAYMAKQGSTCPACQARKDKLKNWINKLTGSVEDEVYTAV